MEKNSVNHIFIYGTLRQGFPASTRLRIGEASEFLTHGSISGTLLNLTAYPGLVEGTNTVHGELYRILADDLIEQLDAYEEFHPHREFDSLFLRKSVSVQTSSAPFTAWTYTYNRNIEQPQVIEHGDYTRYIQENQVDMQAIRQ